jgi:2-keto-4-pentenoate hydratase/2-oxohepta-3-ene-1,7-dioic acid hydratase in catechol pathway
MKVVRMEAGPSIHYGVLDGENIQIWSDAPWKGGVPAEQNIPLTEARLLAPCQPGKVIGMAINFPGATGLAPDFKEPLVFLKTGTSVIGSGETIISPFSDTRVWGECELGVVIGKRLSRCTTDEALSGGVFGYVIGNDVSAENVQGWDHHLPRSKAADTFCALGPWIDTDFQPQGKTIRGYHNQILIREAIASDRLWAEPDLLVWLSSWMTLEPGDVILTGAPARLRERLYLQTGDSYTCTIDGLGELTNPFRCDYGK